MIFTFLEYLGLSLLFLDNLSIFSLKVEWMVADQLRAVQTDGRVQSGDNVFYKIFSITHQIFLQVAKWMIWTESERRHQDNVKLTEYHGYKLHTLVLRDPSFIIALCFYSVSVRHFRERKEIMHVISRLVQKRFFGSIFNKHIALIFAYKGNRHKYL